MHTWDETEQFLIAEATRDLEHGEDITPCLVAFANDEPLFVAFLRSFAKGEYADPIIELLALAAPLDANRLAVSFGARAWSFDDPIPPVISGVGDLRQRVLSITFAEERPAGVDVHTVLVPFTRTEAGADWQPAIRQPGGEGWIPGALRAGVEHRASLAAPLAQMRGQASRCAALGHVMAYNPSVAQLLNRGGLRTV